MFSYVKSIQVQNKAKSHPVHSSARLIKVIQLESSARLKVIQ